MKAIYGYMRVSTVHQCEDRQLIQLQQAGVPIENIFMDKQTGKDFDRKNYKTLVENLNEDTVLFITSIDRLGRNYRELTEQWRIITKERKSDIVVLDMPLLDTRKQENLLGNLISDLVLSLLSYVAESEYNSIKQRQRDGIEAAKKRGVVFGRPSVNIPECFSKYHKLWRAKKISMSFAAEKCGMKPKTFYKVARRSEKLK